MVSFVGILHVRACDLEGLDNPVLELRILSQLTGSSLVLALNFEIAPGFVPDPRRVHPVIVLRKLRIAVEIKAG